MGKCAKEEVDLFLEQMPRPKKQRSEKRRFVVWCLETYGADAFECSINIATAEYGWPEDWPSAKSKLLGAIKGQGYPR
jgi:hypothetical protein